jgi:peroxiredoxin
MNKNFLFLLLVLIVVFITGCERKKKADVVRAIPNQYPALAIQTVDGEQIYTKNLTGKNIFILFHPECDHCQKEATQIRASLEDFGSYNLYFISTAEMEEIARFRTERGFDEVPQAVFSQTTLYYIVNSIGPTSLPTILIFDRNGKFVNKFTGETPISEILSQLDR